MMRTLALAFATALLYPTSALAQDLHAPVRVILIVDSSAAVSPYVNEFRAGLNAFLDTYPEGYDDEIAFVTTGGQLQVRVASTTDRAKLKAAVARFGPDSGANTFVESLIDCERRFLKKSPDHWPVFVILTTDLVPSGDFDQHGFDTLVKTLVDRRGSAHAIVVRNLQSRLTTALTQQLVRSVRGTYESMTLTSSLPAKMKAIADRIYADHHPRRAF
jgi:hypothetical protein